MKKRQKIGTQWDCVQEVQVGAIVASLVATESGPTGNGCQVLSYGLNVSWKDTQSVRPKHRHGLARLQGPHVTKFTRERGISPRFLLADPIYFFSKYFPTP